MAEPKEYRINDVVFTIYNDGSIGIEIIGDNDIIMHSALYDVLNMSINASYPNSP